jgi:hypothetical protein
VDVYVRRLSVLKDKLIYHFKLVMDIVGNSVKQFVYDTDGPTVLETELVGFGVERCR